MKPATKKILIFTVISFATLLLLFVIIDESVPVGRKGPAAERLADKMLKAVNYPAWDTTVAVKWSFRDHHYLWDKKRQLVEVKWDDMRVLLNTVELSGKAYAHGRELEPGQSAEALEDAWKYFANDSFWLAAPFKIRDLGSERSIVETERGEALLIHYTSGGVTPGDTYLWFLAQDGTPVAWKLWVHIIPIGGLEFSWENWQTYATNARLASFHNGIVDVKISGIKLAMDVATLNKGIDPFEQM